MTYSILFSLRCNNAEKPGSRGDPVQPADFVAAFEKALQSPQKFLDTMLKFRTQEVSKERLSRLLTLMQDKEALNPQAFVGQFSEVLRNLTRFVRAAAESAQVYNEIR